MKGRKTVCTFLLCILIGVSGLMSGCGDGNTTDRFNIKTDYQYQYFQPDSALGCNVTEDEDGNLYYLAGSYIYKYDIKNKKNAPLCNKANCLHDTEKDPARYKECNAFFPYRNTESFSGIAYENGYIYLVDPGFYGNGNNTRIIRISKDGSEREILHTFSSQYMNFILHRGYFYYEDEQYDKNNHQHLCIKRYPLEKRGKEETIWTFPAGENGYGIQDIKAYGNHLYFNASGDLNNGKEYYSKYFSYNIQDQKMTEIKPVAYKNSIIFNLMFFNGKVLYYSQNEDRLKDKYNVDIYECNLDGTGTRKTGITMEVGCDMYSDGRYFITSNDNLLSMSAALKKVKNKQRKAEYKVYDSKYHLVDTYSEELKDDDLAKDGYSCYYAPIGIGGMSFCVVHKNDSGTAELYGGDKGQIGRLKGEVFKRDKLASISRSPAASYYLKN
ncbi:MAG: hypothetical protein SPL57_06425 [Lachnospiraceae bacterium]|nr:hypothetical protein [Lachnospiraceae bacterium]